MDWLMKLMNLYMICLGSPYLKVNVRYRQLRLLGYAGLSKWMLSLNMGVLPYTSRTRGMGFFSS